MNRLLPLLLLLAILASCSNNQNTETDLFTDADRPDTSKPEITSAFQANAYPSIFETAFHSETKVKQEDIAFTFSAFEIGKLTIESGKIIACDPIVMHDAMPFIYKFPIGQFPVTLAMAKTSNDERVAFSRILFSTAAIAKWQFALEKGQKPIPLKDTSFYCYGVDGGTGIFIDSIGNKIFGEKARTEWNDVFINKAEENGYKGFIYDFNGHNLATFTTGWGDGCYATYIGLDEKGNICQLLTDFGLVEWWKLPEKK